MRRMLLPVLLLLMLVGAAAPPLAAGEARVEPELQARIDKAIERGATWLQGKQAQDGGYRPAFGEGLPANSYNPLDVGLNALVIQTLAHCGVERDDDSIDKCLKFCRFHYAGGKGSWNLKGNDTVYVYVAATLILALDAANAKGRPEQVVKRDRYGNAIPPKPRPCKMPTKDRKWIKELVNRLVETQVKASGGWRYPGNPIASEDGDTDLSNTQYALLGLDVASRCGIDPPERTWLLAAEHLLREQEEEGVEVPIWLENEAWSPGAPEDVPHFLEIGQTQARGWCYLPGQVTLSTGSMTCAGVTCLGIVKERLWARKALKPELRRRLDKGMLDGLAWLGDHFTIDDNPDPPNQWHYYYLYGLERTGAKTGVRYLAQHDWYRAGALHLLKAQTAEGGWQSAEAQGKPADDTESEITQTCFALLFLKRATREPLVPVTPPTLTGGTGEPEDDR